MIPAIIIGRKGSVGFKGKNTALIRGCPLAAYPIRAAKSSINVDSVYLSTDDDKLKAIASDEFINIIDRPAELATNAALGELAFVHAYNEIKKTVGSIEAVVLLFCNSPTISGKIIDECIAMLLNNPGADSVVTVSRYNMWSPLRARKIVADGTLKPFVDFNVFGDPKLLNCDRDSQGDVWFADMSASVVRPHCLEDIDSGMLPQKWMGQSILPYKQICGCDIDYPWQISMAEWWLDNN